MPDQRAFRLGVGGPVGSGKTALIEALVPRLLEAGYKPLVITNDIFTQEDAEHVRRTLGGVFDPERVLGVETGACPHTAVRDDPTMNLAAIEEMTERFPDADLALVESGGDNLGRVDNHLSHLMMAAKFQNARKLCAVFS
jgi:urease accessory protein